MIQPLIKTLFGDSDAAANADAIEDNKFVLEGGAAALIGGSAGIEIGFNDEGWDNFVDFIVFWD